MHVPKMCEIGTNCSFLHLCVISKAQKDPQINSACDRVNHLLQDMVLSCRINKRQ